MIGIYRRPIHENLKKSNFEIAFEGMPIPNSINTQNKMKKLAPATSVGEKVIQKLRSFPGEHRIAVGLSGGVDSSLTAALFVEAGWDVQGLTLWLLSGSGSCCSEGLVDAAEICEQLNIPHHLIDSRSTFKTEIIEKLVDGYKNGITPLPCSQCNRMVKFGPMIQWAQKELGVELIATGHYARIHHSDKSIASRKNLPSRHQLLRGLDTNKDQSYFLYDLSQEVLEKTLFPLGEISKSDTRKEASRIELSTADKPESQDLCLAEHYGSMKAFLDNYLLPRQGEIILQDGTKLGQHDGIEHFTIGQRKGLGISWKEPLHVIEIDPNRNLVIVAPREDAGKLECIVGAINWVSIAPPKKKISVEVQLRYRSKPVVAELLPLDPIQSDIEKERPSRCRLEFKDEQFSITPGQAAVFYLNDLLLGGGLITR